MKTATNEHRALNASVVKASNAVCARCGKPIAPNELWDLDHDDSDPTQRCYLGPSHPSRNRAGVTHLKEALGPEPKRHSRDW